jgi:hypothetical protein
MPCRILTFYYAIQRRFAQNILLTQTKLVQFHCGKLYLLCFLDCLLLQWRKIEWYLEWNILIMDFNYNLIAYYNLCWEDLVIVYLVVVSNDDVQHNVKHKLDLMM